MISTTSLRDLHVPYFYIPEWPQGAGSIQVRISKPGFFFRVCILPNDVIELRRSLCLGLIGFSFDIRSNGLIEITAGKSVYSSSGGPFFTEENIRVNRSSCLLLFDHLKSEAFLKVIKKALKYAGPKTAEAVKKALKPFEIQPTIDSFENKCPIEVVRKSLDQFIPTLVADILSE